MHIDIFLHDEEGFRHFMRMNYEQFIDLTEMIAPTVSKMDTVMRKSICPKQRLARTLRFLQLERAFVHWSTNFGSVENLFLILLMKFAKQL